MGYIGVGAEIAGTVLYDSACEENLRKYVVADAYPGVGLGVLEQNVVFGLVLFDEVVFQQQRIRLALHHGILGIGYFGDHYRGLAREPLLRDEVLRNSLVQVLGLAHIDDVPVSVIVTVNSALMRKQRYFFPNCHIFLSKQAQK